jgi:hypothetical protein
VKNGKRVDGLCGSSLASREEVVGYEWIQLKTSWGWNSGPYKMHNSSPNKYIPKCRIRLTSDHKGVCIEKSKSKVSNVQQFELQKDMSSKGTIVLVQEQTSNNQIYRIWPIPFDIEREDGQRKNCLME